LWHRLFKALKYGDVLITMGTGKLTQNEERGLGLAGEHDFAVIDMKEQGDQQLFLVKNPWSEGTAWKGHVRQGSGSGNLRGLQIVDSQAPSTANVQGLTPGTFWMGLHHIFQSFESIYLNWNPGLFSRREDIHFTWDVTEGYTVAGSVAANPQFIVSASTAGIVWILLSRHFATPNTGSMTDREDPKSMDDADQGFISLSACTNSDKRVLSIDGATWSAPYVDSPNNLLKLELATHRDCTIVVSQQSLTRKRHNFTLSLMSLTSCTLAPATSQYNYIRTVDGAWTALTAGGNAGSGSYNANPQFSINLPKVSDIFVLLETEKESLPIHVKVVWASGKRVHALTTRDILADSGEYRKGYAIAEKTNVQAGVYTIVCSTFEKGQSGSFNLRIGSSSVCQINQVLVEDAGRFVTKARNAIFSPTADRLVAPLTTRRLNRLSISARCVGTQERQRQDTPSLLRIAVGLGRGPPNGILKASGGGGFIDTSHAEARTGDIDVEPSMSINKGLWISLERLAYSGLQHDETIEVQVLSDEPLDMGSWRTEHG